MKQLRLLFLVLPLVFALVGCGDKPTVPVTGAQGTTPHKKGGNQRIGTDDVLDPNVKK